MQQPPLESLNHKIYHRTQRIYFLLVTLGIGLFTAGIEKATTRLLTPHLGSTLYTEIGIMSALMLCLAIGYYIGGCVATKHVSPQLLYFLTLAAGAYTSVLAGWAASGVRLVASCVTIRPSHIFLASWGSTLLLLAVPLVCIGIIISIIIQLSTYQSIEKAGKTIGKIIAWTTLGSMVGGALSTFLALPFLGTAKTILYSGLLLLVIAIVGFLAMCFYYTNATKVK
jgi:predicted membrane-bound spermidine synthase